MLKKLLALAVFLAVVAIFSRGSIKKGKIVETNYGSVQGIISKSRDGREFYEWLGIPYAQPPIGVLRFASPQPVSPWEGVKDGSSYGAKCAQLELLTFNLIEVEDCLFLNVHIPKLDNDHPKLPVIVYIHGGAFNTMSSNDYRPDYFMDEDVILVVINYRLNLFGFATTGDESIRGNMGLKDQSLALKWIKENIEYFGGNPDQITLVGQSAGASSVHFHLLSPMSKGLFHRGIAHSGVGSEPWSIDSPAHAKLYTENFAKAVNCPTKDSTQLVACLRSKTSTELLEAYLPLSRKHQLSKPDIIGQWFEPTIETVKDSETFLSQHPLAIVEQGKAHQIPLILGQVSSEGLFTTSHFYNDPSKISRHESNFNELTLQLFEISDDTPGKDEIVTKIRGFYFPPNVTTTPDKLDQFTKMFSDSTFNLHIHQVASVQRKFSPTYLYYFNQRGGPSLMPLLISLNEDSQISVVAQAIFYYTKEFINRVIFRSLPPDYGVAHFDDIAFLFYVPNMFYIPKDDNEMYKFSKDFTKLWVSFAKNEHLEFRGLPFSPLDKTGPLKYFELNETPQIVEEVFGDRIAFLKSLGFLEYSY